MVHYLPSFIQSQEICRLGNAHTQYITNTCCMHKFLTIVTVNQFSYGRKLFGFLDHHFIAVVVLWFKSKIYHKIEFHFCIAQFWRFYIIIFIHFTKVNQPNDSLVSITISNGSIKVSSKIYIKQNFNVYIFQSLVIFFKTKDQLCKFVFALNNRFE